MIALFAMAKDVPEVERLLAGLHRLLLIARCARLLELPLAGRPDGARRRWPCCCPRPMPSCCATCTRRAPSSIRPCCLLMLTAMIGIATANRRPQERGAQPACGAGRGLSRPAAGLRAAVPSGAARHDLLNAWFEMISSFTTTGATLYDDPARLAPSLHLWRALVGWLGGFFVLLSAVAILAPLNLGGFEVISGGVVGAGQPGHRADHPHGRSVAATAPRSRWPIFPVYGGLTLALWVALLIGGRDGARRALSMRWERSRPAASHRWAGCRGRGFGRAGRGADPRCSSSSPSPAAPSTARIGPVDPSPLRRDPEVQMALACLAILPLIQFLQHWTGTYVEDQARNVGAAWPRRSGASVFTTAVVPDHDRLRLGKTGQAARAWAGPGSSGLILLGPRPDRRRASPRPQAA